MKVDISRQGLLT